MQNPYQSPARASKPTRPHFTGPWGWARVRLVLYTHLVAIVLAALFSYADRNQMYSTGAAQLVVTPLILFIVLTLLLCPVLMMMAVSRSGVTLPMKVGLLLVEAGLEAVHFLALLPAVQ